MCNGLNDFVIYINGQFVTAVVDTTYDPRVVEGWYSEENDLDILTVEARIA